MRGRFTAVREGKGVKRQGEEKGEGVTSELEQEGKRKWKGREKRENEGLGNDRKDSGVWKGREGEGRKNSPVWPSPYKILDSPADWWNE